MPKARQLSDTFFPGLLLLDCCQDLAFTNYWLSIPDSKLRIFAFYTIRFLGGGTMDWLWRKMHSLVKYRVANIKRV